MRRYCCKGLFLAFAVTVAPCFALHSLDLMLGPRHIRLSHAAAPQTWARESKLGVFLNTGDFSGARDFVASLPSDLPHTKVLHLQLGEALLAAGDKTAGATELDILAGLIEKHLGPEDAAVAARAGYALYRAGLYAKSAAHFTFCLDRLRGEPDWMDWARFCRAVDYWWLKDYDSALRDLENIQQTYFQTGIEGGHNTFGRSVMTGRRLVTKPRDGDHVADAIFGSPYVCPNVLPRVFLLHGNIRTLKGETRNALLSYRTGVELFLSCDCPFRVIQDVAWELCQKLAATYAKLGDPVRARAWSTLAKNRNLGAFEPFHLPSRVINDKN